MQIKIIILLFCLLLKKSIVNGKISIDEQLGVRYQFNMFENFEGTKEVYLQEEKVINKILDFKTRILELRTKLKTLAGGKMNLYQLFEIVKFSF